jgi:hypothetical protein
VNGQKQHDLPKKRAQALRRADFAAGNFRKTTEGTSARRYDTHGGFAGGLCETAEARGERGHEASVAGVCSRGKTFEFYGAELGVT